MRPDNQSLDKPLSKILEGTKEFSSAVTERIRSPDWGDAHKREISHIRTKLLELEAELSNLQINNW